MSRWFRSIFQWKTVWKTACYRYEENVVTGQRRVIPLTSYWVYQPIDNDWLERRQKRPAPPPDTRK